MRNSKISPLWRTIIANKQSDILSNGKRKRSFVSLDDKSLSPLTKEELKAYQSLESYNQFTSGWVKEIKMKLLLTTC